MPHSAGNKTAGAAPRTALALLLALLSPLQASASYTLTGSISVGGACSCCADYGGGTVCATSPPVSVSYPLNVPGLDSGSCNSAAAQIRSVCAQVYCVFSGCNVSQSDNHYCSASASCSGSASTFGNFTGNGIISGAGGLANDFGTTRLAGMEQGLPTFTSHATTANKQWLEEAGRRRQAIESLRQAPEPQSTLDYEARYLERQEAPPHLPEKPGCPDDTSMVCLADSTRQTPNMNLLGEKETGGPGFPGGPGAPQGVPDFNMISGKESVPEVNTDGNALNEKVTEFYGDEVKGSLISKFKDTVKEHIPGSEGLVDRVESTIEGANIYKGYVDKLLPTVFDMITAGAKGDLQGYNEGQEKLNAGHQELEHDTNEFAMKQSGYFAPVEEATGEAKYAAGSWFFKSVLGH